MYKYITCTINVKKRTSRYSISILFDFLNLSVEMLGSFLGVFVQIELWYSGMCKSYEWNFIKRNHIFPYVDVNEWLLMISNCVCSEDILWRDFIG